MEKTSYLEEIFLKNPKKKKNILEFIERFTVIEDVFVEKEIFNHSFKCRYPGCGICCRDGTSINMDEVNRVAKSIEEIKTYLDESKIKRLDKLNNVFYRKNKREGSWRLRTWNSSCIFLMEDKLCAIHKYCMDNDVDWIKFHFNLCVTYPLRINKEQNFIHIEEELKNREYVLPCFNKYGEEDYDESNMLIYSMKDVILDRLGKNFWMALEKNREKN